MDAGKTMDGPPSSPPTDIRVGVINTTAAFVRWSPPPTAMLNGELTGYKVEHLIHFFCLLFVFTLSSFKSSNLFSKLLTIMRLS